MPYNWSPHPRYRLYTSLRSYSPGFLEDRSSTSALEAEICRRFGIESGVCIPMARTGLFLAMSELIRPGQHVVMSPLTIVDVVNAVILAGGVPSFVDIDRDTCGINPELAESRIDSRTGAVLITHLHGQSCGAHHFREICDRRSVPLVEDAAQAFGAVEKGKRLGTIGDVGIYSFGYYKNVTAWRGGMVVARNRVFAERVQKRVAGMRKLSRTRLNALHIAGSITDLSTWPPLFSTLTFPLIRSDISIVNRRLDPEHAARRLERLPESYFRKMRDAQAALCLKQLERVDDDSLQRMKRAAYYDATLPRSGRLRTPPLVQDYSHIYTHYPIQYESREALLDYARMRGRDFSRQHLRNCADLPDFREFYANCPNARAAARELILLPTYPRYPMNEAGKNAEVIADFNREK
jgi:perosamine synthetase